MRIGEWPITSQLESHLVDWLVERMELHAYEPGEVVVKEGRDAERIFIIKRGVASTSIFKENRKRTTYHPDPDQTTTVENQTYQSVGRFFIASVMA